MRRSAVVLPQPDGPDDRPLPDIEVEAVDRGDVTEVLPEVAAPDGE
jgi:hypothetical protein